MASYIQNEISGSNHFLDNVRKMKENSMNFENISYVEVYKNEDIPYMESTIKDLKYFRNIIQEKYFDRLLYKRKIISIDEKQRLEYDMNPYLASTELLGSPDYWWILLMVNKKMNVQEFCKLKGTIFIPDMDDLKTCIIQELNKNNDLGIQE